MVTLTAVVSYYGESANNAFFSSRTVKTPVQPDNLMSNFLAADGDMKLNHQEGAPQAW